MSDICLAREILERGLDRSPRAAIRKALPLLWREPAIRRAPIYSRKITKALAQEVREYTRKNPKIAYHFIDNRFRINPGRVSDIMHGKY